MRALILAAGVGRRLSLASDGQRPKALLEFAGKSLLRRHLDILESCGVRDVTLVVGHQESEIRAELDRLGVAGSVSCTANPRYREGSMVSLATGAAVLKGDAPVLLMDADVLYDERLMRRLVATRLENAFLLDRGIEPGDEPVKLCIQGGAIVDFHKRPRVAHEWHGESVGFFRFSPAVAAELAGRAEAYAAGEGAALEYEEAIRDMVLADGARFGFEEVSDLPWLEIDFAADVRRARDEVLPLLADQAAEADRVAAG